MKIIQLNDIKIKTKAFIFYPFITISLLFPIISIAQLNDIETPSLLKPKGNYKVGHIILDFTDKSRKEPGTPKENDYRQIPVQIWYPADHTTKVENSKYRPRIDAFKAIWDKETIDFMNAVKTDIYQETTVNTNGPFSVLIFSHGWGARSSSHTTLLSNLASYGYIVVGINHPFLGRVALSNGKVTEPNDNQFKDQRSANKYYAQDVSYVISQLTKLNKAKSKSIFSQKINLNKIIAGGHSSGFPAVSGAAVTDKRIKGLISFDSGVPKIVREKGLEIPILLFRAESSSYTDLFFRGKNVHPKGTIYDINFFRVFRADFYDLVISGTTHNSVYDEYLFTEDQQEKDISIRNHGIFGMYTNRFFKIVLENDNLPLLENGNNANPNVTLRVLKAM